jgi:hypothetical protein
MRDPMNGEVATTRCLTQAARGSVSVEEMAVVMAAVGVDVRSPVFGHLGRKL